MSKDLTGLRLAETCQVFKWVALVVGTAGWAIAQLTSTLALSARQLLMQV